MGYVHAGARKSHTLGLVGLATCRPDDQCIDFSHGGSEEGATVDEVLS